jgi:hypothetical protein
MPPFFDLIAVLLVLTGGFGWLKHVLFRLPHTELGFSSWALSPRSC